jgi:hypothetical protein
MDLDAALRTALDLDPVIGRRLNKAAGTSSSPTVGTLPEWCC